jgi:hypothetical protein
MSEDSPKAKEIDERKAIVMASGGIDSITLDIVNVAREWMSFPKKKDERKGGGGRLRRVALCYAAVFPSVISFQLPNRSCMRARYFEAVR